MPASQDAAVLFETTGAASPQPAEPRPAKAVESPARRPKVSETVDKPLPAPVRTIRLEASIPPPFEVTPRPSDSEPARDTAGTILAMRMLNARVAELHARIERLERELAESTGDQSFSGEARSGE